MARFMVKASEYKNVCKAVNDRKLAELKKEIIEILKKQDEKEFKKAIDYFNSQELHYSHLEKSFNGKWIEKAGYGIGTVRIWKGKKYKKIAPGKWARVFDKEGRGTNIAIGKLIARVQKIDNVEDLMAFVMANKQRFVDENGMDLPVLDKLRAAVDARNGNVGNKEKTETRFDSKEVLANLDKYVKTIGGVYGIKKYTEDDDTEKTFARIKEHFDSDSTRTYDDAQGWNQAARQIAEYAKKEGLSTDALIKQSIKNNIKNESIEGTPTFGGKKTEYMERLEEQSKKAEEGRNRQTETKVNGYGEATDREITSLAYKRDVARKERDFNSYFGRGMDKKNNNRGYSKPAEKKKTFKQEMNELYDAQDKAWEGFESGSEIKSSPENSKKFYDRVKKFVEENNIKLTEKHRAEIEDQNGHSFNEALALAGAYGDEAKEKALNRNREVNEKYKGAALDLSQIDEFKESKTDSKSVKEIGEGKFIDEMIGSDGTVYRNHFATKKEAEASAKNHKELGYESRVVEESKAEKQQNRSDAMKGNKNAEKDGVEVEPKLNDPKALEGIDFVNKNKMHALANFLANHDKVTMATAAVRLQAAYEKLGEEKFLAHFPKDVVERYRKEAGKEEPKKKSFTPISKDKMKSMSDDELKDYEAKLEKDLLATSRTDPDYVEKYNHWREVHGENNDRFHQAIEDEARAEKQAEADAKSAKEKEINEKYNGYFENRKGLDKARDLKTLEKKYNFDGKVMSSKEFVEQAMDNGVEIKEREVNKLDYPSRTRWNRMNGYEQDEYEKRIKAAGKKTVYSIDGYEFPKTVVDYAKFYKEKKGNVKKSVFDDFVMDMFIDEDEEIEDAIKTDESLFNDYSAEQPELFNSTEFAVREALNVDIIAVCK